MSSDSQNIVNKAWNFAHVLRDDGLSYLAYTEQITFLLFLKMADEQTKPPYNRAPIVPPKYGWESLLKREGDELEAHYRHILEELGKQPGMLGEIFKKARPEIQNPATLRRLIVDLIDVEKWSSMDADVKGDIYEGLLAKSAAESPKGAGQYFTPRELIKGIVDCVQPTADDTVCDPAAGTGGFLLNAYDYVAKHQGRSLDKDQKKHLRTKFVRGWELVPNTARLCIMNLYLHGIDGGVDATSSRVSEMPTKRVDATSSRVAETPAKRQDAASTSTCPIRSGVDSLASDPDERFSVVLTNPPFGKKSSIAVVNEAGDLEKEDQSYERQDFWTSTKNKQLNFLQHVKTLLKVNGRCAIVVPDNVLFEGGAGETVRRNLLKQCDVHTLLRLPTGIFYAQGVKANVLFFDAKPAQEKPWTKTLWVYDLRTNMHFTQKTNPIQRADLDEFVACYKPASRQRRKATWDAEKNPEGRWRSYDYEDLMKRDKANLDIFWLKDQSLEDSDDLPDPDVLAQEIADDLQTALEQFTAIAEKVNATDH
ncbi:MAG: SAM-dependent DNA methyltransferase [Planctomycetes bacterium]|nr:SAM-dependent DNA methyltransferase [Planctomycetota bacterium]